MRAAWRVVRLVLHLLWGAILLVYYGASNDARRWPVIRRWHQGITRILGVEVKLEGKLPTSNCLWVANHISWLDIPVLGSIVSKPVFLAKSEINSWPLIGWLARRAGTIFILRGHGMVEAKQAINQKLRAGYDVVLFPEGTTTDGCQIRRFHARLFQSALDSNTPVQPVALRYLRDGQPDLAVPFTNRANLLVSLWRIARNRQTYARVSVCDRLALEGEQPSRDKLARQAQEQVATKMGLL